MSGQSWRRVYSVALALLLGFACGEPENDSSEGDSQTLRIGIEERPKTLDPRYASDAAGQRISRHLIFSSLVQHDEQLEIMPDLAERWEILDDTTYVFHLRPGVLFHDGEPLTAEDVKFTFEHLMDPTTASPFGVGYRDKIKHIVVLDPQTVRFELTGPVAPFLTSAIVPILPRHLLVDSDENFAQNLVGSGPFRFVEQTPQKITLAAYQGYFGGAPAIETLTCEVVADENIRFLKLRKGELDLLINALPPQQVAHVAQAPIAGSYRLIEEPGLSYNYLAFNLSDPQVQPLAVRQAIAHGIHIDELIEHRLDGRAQRARSLLAPINPFHNPEAPLWQHDPTKARALLDAAGLKDPDGDGPTPRLTLELKTSNNSRTVGHARILQAQLAQVGIRLELKSYEWGTFYGDIQSGNFQLTLMRWVGATEPDFYYEIFHSTQAPPQGRNRGRYANTEVDRLLELGRVTLDPQERHTIYSQVQKILATELPYISLWHINNITVLHQRVQGYRQHPKAGFLTLKDISLNSQNKS